MARAEFSSMPAVVLAALQALYLFAPLLLAAAISGVVLRLDWLKALKRPLDVGAMVRRRRLFGANKTWRGLVLSIAGSIAGVAAQRLVQAAMPVGLQVIDYSAANPVMLGTAMGLGAVVGELPNSFVKRQVGIPPGQTKRGWGSAVFYVWDQVDLLMGAWPLLLPWIRPTGLLLVMSFVVALALHPAIALVGYLVGARATAR